MERQRTSVLARQLAVLESKVDRRTAEFAVVAALLNASRDTALVVDIEGTVIAANEVAASRLGTDAAGLVGQSIRAYLPPELAESRLSWAEEVVRTRRPAFFEDSREGRVFENIVYPITDESGSVATLAIFARDVTAERAVLTEAEELRKQLHQSQKLEAVGRLAGGVAHDFNNIITAILGNVDMALEELDADSAVLAMLQEIEAAAERAAQVTNQLLAFSRKQVATKRTLDAGATVARCMTMLSKLVGANVELHLQTEARSLYVRLPPGQLDQIVLNLVVNAHEAMPDGGRITLKLSEAHPDEERCRAHVDARPGHYVVISVADAGMGMDETTRERLFEPFYTTKATGSGLGLATVYGIVAAAGGFIVVDSTLGVGTTLHVYLPAKQAPSSIAMEGPALSTAGGTETILLAEDEVLVGRMGSRVLTKADYHVIEASSGAEAIRRSREHQGRIHLLVTDVVMHEMLGKELYAELLRERPQLRVLFSSGHARASLPSEGALGDQVDLLKKPFTPRELM